MPGGRRDTYLFRGTLLGLTNDMLVWLVAPPLSSHFHVSTITVIHFVRSRMDHARPYVSVGWADPT